LRGFLIAILLSTGCGRIGFDPLGASVNDDSGVDSPDADLRCTAGLRFESGACVACEAEEFSCGDGVDEDCDGMPDCRDPDCLGQECNSMDCSTQVCEAGGACSNDTAFFATSWEDGTGEENQGGCSEWTGTVGSATSVVASPVSDMDSDQVLLYQGISNNNEAVYLAFAPQDRSSARFFMHVADWQADNDAFRTMASFTIDGQPNGAADGTAIYLRLLMLNGLGQLELRYYDGTNWIQFDLLPLTLDSTYQVEMLHETQAGGGAAGWRVWSADGRTMIHEQLIANSTSVRQVNAFFFGSGNASGVTQNTEIYFDAIKLGTDGWLQPLRRP
jgi:hypothetical protein